MWLCLYTCTCFPLLLVRGAAWAWNVESYRCGSWEPHCLCNSYNQGWLFPVEFSNPQNILSVHTQSSSHCVVSCVGNRWQFLEMFGLSLLQGARSCYLELLQGCTVWNGPQQQKANGWISGVTSSSQQWINLWALEMFARSEKLSNVWVRA